MNAWCLSYVLCERLWSDLHAFVCKNTFVFPCRGIRYFLKCSPNLFILLSKILGTFVHLWMYSSWCQIWSSNYFTIFYFWQICNVLVMSFAHACYIMHYWKVIWDSTHWIRIFSKKDTDIMIYVCYIHTFYTIRYNNKHYGRIMH